MVAVVVTVRDVFMGGSRTCEYTGDSQDRAEKQCVSHGCLLSSWFMVIWPAAATQTMQESSRENERGLANRGLLGNGVATPAEPNGSNCVPSKHASLPVRPARGKWGK
jgi:hypothetical protein